MVERAAAALWKRGGSAAKRSLRGSGGHGHVSPDELGAAARAARICGMAAVVVDRGVLAAERRRRRSPMNRGRRSSTGRRPGRRRPVLLLSNSLGTRSRCGSRRLQALRAFRCSATTAAVTAPSAVRRAPMRSSGRGRCSLGLLDALGVGARASAACRWAAWSACGSASTRRSASTGWCSPTPRRNIGTPECGTRASRLVQRKGWPPVRGVIERWFTPALPGARDPATVERMRSCCARTRPRQGYVACCAAVRDMDHVRYLLASRRRRWWSRAPRMAATPPITSRFDGRPRSSGAAFVELLVLLSGPTSRPRRPASLANRLS